MLRRLKLVVENGGWPILGQCHIYSVEYDTNFTFGTIGILMYADLSSSGRLKAQPLLFTPNIQNPSKTF
jgi:hypothetical protein